MIRTRVGVVVVMVGAALLLTSPAQAQNYREMAIGGRTATMGGAGTAAGNDSAMPYLNPAGLAGVPGDIFAVSATVYAVTHRSFKNFFFPQGTPPELGYQPDNESFATSSVGELPSSVMYFRHLNPTTDRIHHHLGVSLVIPSARNVDLVANLTGRLTTAAGSAAQATSLQVQSRDYYIGPTYAAGIGNDLRFGASLYGLYQRAVLSYSADTQLSLLGGSTSLGLTTQSASVVESLSLAPIVGVQARLVSDLWLGLGIAAPTVGLGGRQRSNSQTTGKSFSNGREVPTSSLTTADIEAQKARPLRVNAGVAWQRPKGFSAAADVHVYFARTTATLSGSQLVEERQTGDLTRRYRTDAAATEKSQAVVDLSVGAEYAISEIVAMRAGFFTDVASQPEIPTDARGSGRMRLDRFGGTLGVGLKVGSFDTTAGVVLARGSGTYGAANLSDLNATSASVYPIKTTETTGMLVLSGAVTVEEAKKAIRNALPLGGVPLPDLELGHGRTPAPWLSTPLPAEAKPPPPRLRRGGPETVEPSTPLPGAP